MLTVLACSLGVWAVLMFFDLLVYLRLGMESLCLHCWLSHEGCNLRMRDLLACCLLESDGRRPSARWGTRIAEA